MLVAEHDNPYDPNAVSGWINRVIVGHLSRGDAQSHRAGLLKLQSEYGTAIALPGQIVGGGAVEGRRGMLG